MERNGLPVELKTDDLYGKPENQDIPEEQESNEALHAASSIQTYYEKMWLERGLSIKYIKFHLPQQGLLEEPDIEIELDDYRSYHRTKRSSLEKAK